MKYKKSREEKWWNGFECKGASNKISPVFPKLFMEIPLYIPLSLGLCHLFLLLPHSTSGSLWLYLSPLLPLSICLLPFSLLHLRYSTKGYSRHTYTHNPPCSTWMMNWSKQSSWKKKDLCSWCQTGDEWDRACVSVHGGSDQNKMYDSYQMVSIESSL